MVNCCQVFNSHLFSTILNFHRLIGHLSPIFWPTLNFLSKKVHKSLIRIKYNCKDVQAPNMLISLTLSLQCVHSGLITLVNCRSANDNLVRWKALIIWKIFSAKLLCRRLFVFAETMINIDRTELFFVGPNYCASNKFTSMKIKLVPITSFIQTFPELNLHLHCTGSRVNWLF